jgi:hypothetical protein
MGAHTLRRQARNGGDGSVWRTGPPSTEARALFLAAGRNGGIEHMRELISVSVKEKTELAEWAAAEPELADKIETMIRFRVQVLAEFDRIAGLPAQVKNPIPRASVTV